MTRDWLLKRIDELIDQGKEVLATRHRDSEGYGDYVDTGKIKGLRGPFLRRAGLRQTHSH